MEGLGAARDAGTVPCMQGTDHSKYIHSPVITGNIQHTSNHSHGYKTDNTWRTYTPTN